MIIGISKERLIELRNAGGLHGRTIFTLIDNECAELNPWQPIESAPKDRNIIIYFTSGIKESTHWDHYYNNWYAQSSDYIGQPTHWQELPEDPK